MYIQQQTADMVSRTFRLAMDLGAVCSDCGGCKSDNREQTRPCPGHGGIRETMSAVFLSAKITDIAQTSILPLLRGSHKSLSVVFALDAVQLERTACKLVRPKSERQRMMSARMFVCRISAKQYALRKKQRNDKQFSRTTTGCSA